MAIKREPNVVLLVGGVGGAKLALGLQHVLPPEHLTIIVNTGDDFWHYGLRICPDVDTVLYTLSGRVDPQNGWGLADDTTTTLETLGGLGAETWFRLGDKDLATHLLRTHLLREGHTLTEVVQHLGRVLGVQPAVLPMTDAPVTTMVDTIEQGELEFQEYFVRHRWQPTLKSLRYAGIEDASMTDAVRNALEQADLILIGPSNPWLSIAPILAVPGMQEALLARAVPRIAITPIVEGKALKGPAAKLMQEMGHEVTAAEVARYYSGIITAFVYDQRDTLPQSLGFQSVAFDTIMKTDHDKARLARQVLAWAGEMETI